MNKLKIIIFAIWIRLPDLTANYLDKTSWYFYQLLKVSFVDVKWGMTPEYFRPQNNLQTNAGIKIVKSLYKEN